VPGGKNGPRWLVNRPRGSLFAPYSEGLSGDSDTGNPPRRDDPSSAPDQASRPADSAAGTGARVPPPGSQAASSGAEPDSGPATSRSGASPPDAPANGAPPRPDTAPSGLPRRTPGQSHAGRGSPPRRPPRLSPPPEPSWGTVLATTVRLWTKRRLASRNTGIAVVLVLAAIVFAGAVVQLALRGASHNGHEGTSQGGSQAGPGAGAGGAAGALTSAAVRHQAAVWVAHQVSGDVVVACDPAMCGALQTAGVAAGRLLVLRPGQGDPLGSEILLVTAAVHSQFGNRLTSVYAPIVLAGFGSGSARIEVRVVAPDGAKAYLAQLAADVAARRSAGAALLHNSSIRVAAAARSELIAGQVDPRLLLMVVTLSHAYPVDIVSFGSQASGASTGVPLRFAEITGAAPAPGRRPVSMRVLRSFLDAQRTPYRPATVTTVRLGSRTALDVEYPAPSPLGLLGSHG
jgi:hypothetical protein